MHTEEYCDCGSCDLCESNNQLLIELKIAGHKIRPLNPRDSAWHKIEENLPSKKNNRLVKSLIPLVASVAFALIGFISWQQYQLKSDFERILVMNHLLEEKISTRAVPLYQQAAMNSALSTLDTALINATNMKQKLEILAKRKIVIEKFINEQKGETNEFSI